MSKHLQLLSPMVLVSCFPNLMVPTDFSIEKNNDEAFIDLDSIAIGIRNLEMKGDHYVFWMDVQNKSQQPLLINPVKIRKYSQYPPYKAHEKGKQYPNGSSAMAPSQVNRLFETKKRDAEAAATFLFLLGAAITTYDAIKDCEDNTSESWTAEDEKKSLKRELITTSTLLATNILADATQVSGEKAEVELQHLPQELFRADTIHPGESYAGKILFKRVNDYYYYHRITFSLEEIDFLFDFRRAKGKEKRFLFEKGF